MVDVFIPGQKMAISRETFIGFKENAFHEINEENTNAKYANEKGKTIGYIRRSFEHCGLNPYAYNTDKFKQHLDKLSLDSVYNPLTEAHEAECL